MSSLLSNHGIDDCSMDVNEGPASPNLPKAASALQIFPFASDLPEM